MKTSDKFTIATFVSLIPVAIAMWLAYIYQTEASYWLMLLCLAITFFFGLAAHTAEENEPKPPFY